MDHEDRVQAGVVEDHAVFGFGQLGCGGVSLAHVFGSWALGAGEHVRTRSIAVGIITCFVKLLVEKVIVSPNDLEVRLRANGIERLVLELQPAGAAQPEEALA